MKSRNVFERIQKMKKNRMCTVQYVPSNPNILLLTSSGLARKVEKIGPSPQPYSRAKECYEAARSKTPKRAAWVRVKHADKT